ncbi:three-Cys-motif partner protein TcmP [Thermicanus aegyptius]|uniref:three-Cys-motif partner protein TcmP n=1 Tax=Thermicanus aegyptius TaxID=94009 RepID=UPI0003FDB7C2|nr:three-Cys-motif partner protein TcmP [Thermicanus aegyptius]
MSDFFEEITESSEVKSEIVRKYFGAWANIMKSRSTKMVYIDLFSGPGRYKDGSESTPLKILKQIIQNPALREKMVTIFNDKKESYAKNLMNEISKLEGIDSLKYKPLIVNTEVGDEIVNLFESINLAPTLAFIDPWGYKGLSLRLIRALVKDWGSDLIFFFNYNRVSMGLNNSSVTECMNNIFGEERVIQLKEEVKFMSPYERELTILNSLAESLSDQAKYYVLPFQFVNAKKNRTSHYLIFVSKHELGYTLMKEIMWDHSSEKEDGVASFSFIPLSQEYQQLSILSLYSRPLDELGIELMRKFSGKTMSVLEIFKKHHVGTPYILRNYKEALSRLEEQKRIKVNPPAEKRRMRKGKRTFPDTTIVLFP